MTSQALLADLEGRRGVFDRRRNELCVAVVIGVRVRRHAVTNPWNG